MQKKKNNKNTLHKNAANYDNAGRMRKNDISVQ